MKTRTVYDVVYNNDRNKFEAEVNKRIGEDWKLQGGVSVCNGVHQGTGVAMDCFFQAMTIEVPVPDPAKPPAPPVVVQSSPKTGAKPK